MKISHTKNRPTSEVVIGDHFTAGSRILDPDVVTGDEHSRLFGLLRGIPKSPTALVAMFLVGRAADLALQGSCSWQRKKPKKKR